MSQCLIQPDLNSFSILIYLLVFYGSCLEMILQASGSLLEFYILLKHVLIWCFDHDGGEWQQGAPKSLIGLSGWMMVIAKAVAYGTHYFILLKSFSDVLCPVYGELLP